MIPPRLTPREKDIIEQIMARMTRKEIAKNLKLSPRTVKKNMHEMFRKFNIDDRFSKTVRLVYLYSRREIE